MEPNDFEPFVATLVEKMNQDTGRTRTEGLQKQNIELPSINKTGISTLKRDVDFGNIYTRLNSGQYIPKYESYTTGIGEEDRLARMQSTGEKWLYGTGKFWAKTGINALDATLGTANGILEIFKEGKMSAFYDNEFERNLDDLRTRLDTNLANHYTNEEKAMSFLRSMGTANFWANDFGDAMAFLAGAALPEVAIGIATGGSSFSLSAAKFGARTTGRAALREATESASKNLLKRTVGKVDEALGFSAGRQVLREQHRAVLGKKVGDAFSTTAFLARTSGFEAGMEARHNLKESVDQYISFFERENGRMPDYKELQEFTTKAISTANGVFAANLGILSVSNAAMYGKLFGVKVPELPQNNIFNRAIGQGYDISKGVASLQKPRKLIGNAYHVLKRPFSEGFFEEGLQGVAGGTMQRYLEATYDPTKVHTESVMGALSEAFAHQYGTAEGMKEVWIGSLVGAIGGGLIGKPINMLTKQGGSTPLVAGFGSDSYSAHRNNLQKKLDKANQATEELRTGLGQRNLFRSSAKASDAFETTQSPMDAVAQRRRDFNFILAQQEIMPTDEVVENYRTVIESTPLTEEQQKQIQKQGLTVEEYKQGLIENFKATAESVKEAEKIVDAFNIQDVPITAGNKVTLREAMMWNITSGQQAMQRASSIAQELEQITGSSGLADKLKFYTNLKEEDKQLVEELKDLKEQAKAAQQAVVDIQSDIQRTPKQEQDSKQYAEKYTLAAQRVTQISDRISVIEQALEQEQKTSNMNLRFVGSQDQVFFVNDIVEQLDQFNNYVEALEKAGKGQEALAVKELLQAFAIETHQHKEFVNAHRRMMGNDFFRSEEGRGFLSKLLGEKYLMPEDVRNALNQNDQRFEEALERAGITLRREDGETFGDALKKALETTEELSDREKFRMESLIRLTLNMEYYENMISDFREYSDNIQKAEDQPIPAQNGDTVALKRKVTEPAKETTALNAIQKSIEEITKQIDFLRGFEKSDAEVAQLEQQLADLRSQLEQEQVPPVEEDSMVDVGSETSPTVSQSEIETKKSEIERRRQGLNGVEEIIFNNPNFRLEGFEIDGNYWNVVTSTDRAKVLVNINGVIVPFYLTTGQAGKGLVPGWYPFFGIGKDGWLNKTDKSDMETYYERYWGKETADIVKSVSDELNSFYGTDPATFKNDGDPNATSKPLTTLADKVEDYINSKLSYTPAINNADARKILRSNVEQLGKEINDKYDTELKASEEQQTPPTVSLGEPTITKVDDGDLYEFRTEQGLVGGVLISPTEFRIDGISARETGKGQGTQLFEALLDFLRSKGVTTLSTISAGEGAVAMHNRAVGKGLLEKVFESGRTATFNILPQKDDTSSPTQTLLTRLQDLPTQQGREQDFQEALNIIDSIDFNSEDSISEGISKLANYVSGKDISQTKQSPENFVRGKEKLIGNDNFKTKEYLESYVSIIYKDFDKVDTKEFFPQEQTTTPQTEKTTTSRQQEIQEEIKQLEEELSRGTDLFRSQEIVARVAELNQELDPNYTVSGINEEQTPPITPERVQLQQQIDELQRRLDIAKGKIKIVDTEEFQRYKELKNKEQQATLTDEEIDEMELLETEVDRWIFATGAVIDGTRLSSLIEQEAVLQSTIPSTPEDIEVLPEQEEPSDEVDVKDAKRNANTHIGLVYDKVVTSIRTKGGEQQVVVHYIKKEGLEALLAIEEPLPFTIEQDEEGNLIVPLDYILENNENPNAKILFPLDFKEYDRTYGQVLLVTTDMEGNPKNVPLPSDYYEREKVLHPVNTTAIYESQTDDVVTLTVHTQDAWNKKILDEVGKTKKKLEKVTEETFDEEKAISKNLDYIQKNPAKSAEVIERERQKFEEGKPERIAKAKKAFEDAKYKAEKDLKIDMMDSKNRNISVLKGQRNYIHFKDVDKQFQVFRKVMVQQYLEQLLGPNKVEIGQVKIEKVFTGMPTMNKVRREDNSLVNEFKPFTAKMTEQVVDIGYRHRGKIATRSGEKGIDTTFLGNRGKGETKMPFIVLQIGNKKMAFPVRLATQQRPSTEPFKKAYEADTDPQQKAINLNRIAAELGLDIKKAENAFYVGIGGIGNLNDEQYQKILGKLESIEYFYPVEEWKEKRVSTQEILMNQALVNIDVFNPVHSPKVAFKMKEFFDAQNISTDLFKEEEQRAAEEARTREPNEEAEHLKGIVKQAEQNTKRECQD
jgi:hypothetical protein